MLITSKVSGISEVIANIDSLKALLDSDEILDMALAVTLANTQARFLDKEDPEGRPWTPSQAGLDREYLGFPFGTLYDTGNLYESLKAERLDKGVGVVYNDDGMAPYGFELYDQWYFLGPSSLDEAEYTGNALDMLIKAWRF